jgi:nucleoside-diphosphate-sugar epimerase
MKVAVTGANGFLGAALSNYLLGKSIDVVKIQRCSGGDHIIGNINANTDWFSALERCDTVIHTAAKVHSPSNEVNGLASFMEVNRDGTLNLARQAAELGVKRFIFISTIGVHGSKTNGQPFSEESSCQPYSDYAKSKNEAELGLKKVSLDTGMEIVVIRPTLIYGKDAPGNFNRLVKLIKCSPLLPFSLCDNRRSFISVNNLCDFIFTCVVNPDAANHTFVISDGHAVSISEFTNCIADALGKKIFQLPIPVPVMLSVAKAFSCLFQAEQLLCDLDVDISKSTYLLKWTPPETMAVAMSKIKCE